MGINEKDIKILWSKAAGYCSMRDCNKKLVLKSQASSNTTLIGENCHIVAGKVDGPRGESHLSLKERNNYNNLILLCRDHHKIIDDDPKTWTIEKLHELKIDHESWVNQNLEQSNDGLKAFYIGIANEIVDRLYIANWDMVSDNLIRTLMYEPLYDNIRELVIKLESLDWPKGNYNLNKAFEDVSQRLHLLIENYASNTYLRGDNHYVEDKRWKSTWHSQEVYAKYINNSEEWYSKHYKYFRNVIVSLNRLFSTIRTNVDQLYLLNLGNLTIRDELGILGNGMESMVYFPSKYVD